MLAVAVAAAPYGALHKALEPRLIPTLTPLLYAVQMPENSSAVSCSVSPDSTARCPGYASRPWMRMDNPHIPQRPTLRAGQHQAFHDSESCSTLV
jgi:hypothetical protein